MGTAAQRQRNVTIRHVCKHPPPLFPVCTHTLLVARLRPDVSPHATVFISSMASDRTAVLFGCSAVGLETLWELQAAETCVLQEKR